MGRRRQSNLDLPPHVRLKKGRYYFDHGGTPRKWTPLGADKNEALRRWAELMREPVPAEARTFSAVMRRFRAEEIPSKSRRTQIDYLKQLQPLELTFGAMAIDEIRPVHVEQYHKQRGQRSRVQANREKTLLSMVFKFARAHGFTDKPNPCDGIRSFPEPPRDAYVSDGHYLAVYKAAHWSVQDAMDIAYYTGQRPGDVLRMTVSDIVEQGGERRLLVKQGKTGKRLRIAIDGPLAAVIERILARPTRDRTVRELLQTENGAPLTTFALRSRFDKARESAGVSFQFRDLRPKAASDLDDARRAQKLLGHSTMAITERVYANRKGEAVAPVMQPLPAPNETVSDADPAP